MMLNMTVFLNLEINNIGNEYLLSVRQKLTSISFYTDIFIEKLLNVQMTRHCVVIW